MGIAATNQQNTAIEGKLLDEVGSEYEEISGNESDVGNGTLAIVSL